MSHKTGAWYHPFFGSRGCCVFGTLGSAGSKSWAFLVWGNSQKGRDCSAPEFNPPPSLTSSNPRKLTAALYLSPTSKFCVGACWGWLASPSSHLPSKLLRDRERSWVQGPGVHSGQPQGEMEARLDTGCSPDIVPSIHHSGAAGLQLGLPSARG